MEFLGIPAEVVDAYVLPYLGWNDLLRLRRVCKWTKAITDDFLKVHPELAPELEINEEDKDFRAFLKMGIPTARIFLNNQSGGEFYEKGGEAMLEFLADFGRFVKFLRMDQISFSIVGEETKFLDALKNLQSLEAERYGGYPRGLDPKKVWQYLGMKWKEVPEDSKESPPSFFGRLKKLKIGNNDDAVLDNEVFTVVVCFLMMGLALESFALPFSRDANPHPGLLIELSEHVDIPAHPLALAFALLAKRIVSRSQQDPPVANYKEIDFVSYHQNTGVDQLNQFVETWKASPYFLALSHFCVANGVKLENVRSSWLLSRHDIANQEYNNPDLGIPVGSLVNLHPDILSLDMPNLERIQIKSTSQCSVGTEWRNQRPAWPSLKSLDINVDSTSGKCLDWNQVEQRPLTHNTSTVGLLNFFFLDVSRAALTELRLQFPEKTVGDTVTIPNTGCIVSACPNLKKLTLVKWPGTNKALTKLWSELPALEEISLEYCEALGNVAFVGEDMVSPVFLKLAKLKKLSFKGLDAMPMITDTLFSLVIRHTKLTHLILTSETPIKSVTLAGVRSLCDGDFAESIQKFPFKNWSLENVTAKEFEKLEDMFRSSKML